VQNVAKQACLAELCKSSSNGVVCGDCAKCRKTSVSGGIVKKLVKRGGLREVLQTPHLMFLKGVK
ncbi:hypothetical protein ACQVTS_33085, partial [Bacillus mycoides]